MTKSIIMNINGMNEFYNILQKNDGVVIFKFGAEWCSPCKKIESFVTNWFNSIHTNPDITNIQLVYIDVDESFELYAQLKTKKMIQGIPAILAYYKGNETIIVDNYVSGTNENSIDIFFNNCINKAKTLL